MATKAYDSPCFERAYLEMDPDSSGSVLPYPAERAYRLSQTYCGPTGGHHHQLADDLLMPIGDEVVASRSGVVRAIREDSPDNGQGFRHNHVLVEHADVTVGFYEHLFRNPLGPVDCRGGLIPGETYYAGLN